MSQSLFGRVLRPAFGVLFVAAFLLGSQIDAAQALCSAGSTDNDGAFLSLADQGGGFGDPSNIETFLNANGFNNAMRVAKIDLNQGGDCATSNGVTASPNYARHSIFIRTN